MNLTENKLIKPNLHNGKHIAMQSQRDQIGINLCGGSGTVAQRTYKIITVYLMFIRVKSIKIRKV